MNQSLITIHPERMQMIAATCDDEYGKPDRDGVIALRRSVTVRAVATSGSGVFTTKGKNMKKKVTRYAVFVTEVNGQKLEHRLSYWQAMSQFVVLPTVLTAIIIAVILFFFSGVQQ